MLSRQAASMVFIKQSCVWLRSVALCSTDTLIQVRVYNSYTVCTCTQSLERSFTAVCLVLSVSASVCRKRSCVNCCTPLRPSEWYMYAIQSKPSHYLAVYSSTLLILYNVFTCTSTLCLYIPIHTHIRIILWLCTTHRSWLGGSWE